MTFTAQSIKQLGLVTKSVLLAFAVGSVIDRQSSGAAPLSTNDLVASFSKANDVPQHDPEPVWHPDDDSDDGKGTKQKVRKKYSSSMNG